nr:NAD-dependent epimerase/dehydratase family protein [uncultured Mucilaginibacter sp.]
MAQARRIKVIITGATGMVGEGVLLECLQNDAVSEVLAVSRRLYNISHPKLEQLIVPDMFDLSDVDYKLTGYDACFFCAGVSSLGLKELEYTHITYDLTLNFAKTLVTVNPQMTFIYVSGSHTDSTEVGRIMWARVKGRTENDLARLPFKRVYNFRPGLMRATQGQKNLPAIYKYLSWLFPLIKSIAPNGASTLADVGRSMIKSVINGYPKGTLEISDINKLAQSKI